MSDGAEPGAELRRLGAAELPALTLTEGGVSVRLLELARLGDLEADAARFLTGAERDEYAELRHPQRRREWLGARVCLKLMAFERALVADPLACAVVKDPRGRPRLVAAKDLVIDVVADCSLSHKGRFVCAALATVAGARVGVDIEEISPRLQRLAREFTHERDRVLGDGPEPERLAILWALKEACSKVLGRGLALALREVVCEETAPGRHRVSTSGRELVGRHTLYEGYAVAVCLGTDRAFGG